MVKFRSAEGQKVSDLPNLVSHSLRASLCCPFVC